MTACKSNQKNIATALEYYARAQDGQYPESLEQLVPVQLDVLPVCPAAGYDTYSAPYRASGDHYEFGCDGLHHQSVDLKRPGFPRYNSEDGLIER